jgi:glycosyltransferase involved in cell wall biosynthesis
MKILKTAQPEKPLVSIVTPVFNGRRYLEQTIKSVLAQTYDNIEYIIIDGGSNDGSIDIIKKYGQQVDFWSSESDAGMYDAVNKGLKIASGEILAYLNSDDLYYSDTVEFAVDYFKKNAAAELIYGNCDFIDSYSNFLYNYRYPTFRWEFFISRHTSSIPQQTTFWRRGIHHKIGYFDSGLKMCGDFDFYAKAGQCCRIEHTQRTLAKYRIHAASLTTMQATQNKKEVDVLHRRYQVFKGARRSFFRLWAEAEVKCLNLALMFRKLIRYVVKK